MQTERMKTNTALNDQMVWNNRRVSERDFYTTRGG